MTDKMRAFGKAVATGVPEREAALAAGYGAPGAAAQASKLMARADMREFIAKLRGKETKTTEEDVEPLIVDPSSSLDVLRQLYMNPKAPTGLRFEAAKAALPYEHGKKGEKGKKEKLQDEAKEAAGGDFTPRRRPGRPSLKAVA